MPKFAFEARDNQGRSVRGTREAADQSALLNALRARELEVTHVHLAPQQNVTPQQNVAMGDGVAVAPHAPPLRPTPPSRSTPPPAFAPPSVPRTQSASTSNASHASNVEKLDWTARANAKQISLFFWQMHAMLHAGTSLSQALSLSAKHDPNPSLRRASGEMSIRTGQGEEWSVTMRRYPGLFSDLMIGLIGAGESSGTLDTTCARLAGYAERDYEIQQTIKRETWYPKILLACSIFIPSVVTLILKGVTAWLGVIWTHIVFWGAVWLVWKAFNWAAPLLGHQKGWKKWVDSLKLMLPIGGKVARGFATAKFCRALAATYSAGMAPHRALKISADACDNAAIGQSIENVIPNVERGDGLTASMASTKQFPPIALQMLGTGEATGKIDSQLEKVADFLEQDAETATKQAVKVLCVLVFLLVAVQIGTQIIEFYTGYFGDLLNGAEG